MTYVTNTTNAQTDCLHIYINIAQPVEDMLAVVVQFIV